MQSREQTYAEVVNSVSSIIEDVKINKDAAVVKYTKRFDNINLESMGLFYGPNEIRASINSCSLKDKEAIDLSISRILEFHKKQIPSNLNWKDTLGDWGVVECTGTHTAHKNKGIILKNYCIGTNVEDDNFWLIMDRESDSFDAGIGEIKYVNGTGKFKKYIGTNCVYAVSHLKQGKGSFIKAKCNFK